MLTGSLTRGENSVNDLALVELVEATSRSVKDALALLDEHGVVLAVNAAYRELYGFTEREVVGRSFAVIFPEDQRGAAEAAYLQVFQRAAPALHRSMIRRFDGADRRVESRITLLSGAGAGWPCCPQSATSLCPDRLPWRSGRSLRPWIWGSWPRSMISTSGLHLDTPRRC